MQKNKVITLIKIALVAVVCVFLALLILIIVQTVQLHKLKNENKQTIEDLNEIISQNEMIDKEISAREDEGYLKDYYEQEHGYGSSGDYNFN